MSTPSRSTVLAQEWEAFQASVRLVDREVLEEFLHTIRWWSASRDPKLMRLLTEASRLFGALRLEAVTRR